MFAGQINSVYHYSVLWCYNPTVPLLIFMYSRFVTHLRVQHCFLSLSLLLLAHGIIGCLSKAFHNNLYHIRYVFIPFGVSLLAFTIQHLYSPMDLLKLFYYSGNQKCFM